MPRAKILFFSGSVGLCHVWRDLAIAREIRLLGEVEISWLAASPADRVIREAGESLLPESVQLTDDSDSAEGRAGGAGLSLVRYAAAARTGWSRNVGVVDRLVAERGFDLLIGDETHEVSLAYRKQPSPRRCPFVMICDFVGMEAMSWSPIERIGAYLWNRSWAEGYERPPSPGRLNLFVGQEDDICGPRLAPTEVAVPAGVEVRGYVPALREHLAACDLAIVQGGGTVTLELTALRRPSLFFPIEGHSEQEISVAERLRRHGAGVRLRASATTPVALAEAIAANVGRPVSCSPIRTDGAKVAARLIAELLGWQPAGAGAPPWSVSGSRGRRLARPAGAPGSLHPGHLRRGPKATSGSWPAARPSVRSRS